MMTPQRFAGLVAKPVLGLFVLSLLSCIGALAIGAREAALLFNGAAIAASITLIIVGFIGGWRQ